MKGYKAFDADFKCRGKQYEPGKNYEEDSAEMCKSGMHFCEQPLAVLSYYPAIDKNGKPTRFAKVEAEDAQADADNQKFVTKKLKIGAEIKLGALIDAQVQFVREKAEEEKTAASGDNGSAVASGDNCSAAASGNFGSAAASGNYGSAAASGDNGSAAASGNYGSAAVTGIKSSAIASGKQCIAVAWGIGSKAKGSVGSWLVLSEHDSEGNITNGKLVLVDGDAVKDDTFYILENGEIKEWREGT